METGRVVIYGGKGTLGSTCVIHFKANNWWVVSIDQYENDNADVNVIVDKNDDVDQQESKVLNSVSAALNGSKLDAIICVAGSWAGGNARRDLIKNSDQMWRQSVWSSLISASIAVNHLKEGGLLSLTGARSALNPTPGMIGYGIAKAAVHHLVKSLAEEKSGLPKDVVTVAVLPVTLDTPINRKLPDAEGPARTSLESMADIMLKWSSGIDRPSNGSLVKLVTKDSNIEIVLA